MTTQGTSHARSPSLLSTWSEYFARFMHPSQPMPVRLTRRQELLAAQDRKRQEHRDHVLELLREVKEKHHQEVMHTK